MVVMLSTFQLFCGLFSFPLGEWVRLWHSLFRSIMNFYLLVIQVRNLPNADHQGTGRWWRGTWCICFYCNRSSGAKSCILGAKNITACSGFVGWSGPIYSSWWTSRKIFFLSSFSVAKSKPVCLGRGWPLSPWWQAWLGPWKVAPLVG